jgi:hypothetical protein
VQDGGAQGARGQARQGALHALLAAFVEDAFGLQQGRQRLAVVEALAQVGEAADLAGQGPQHEQRGLAFALQAFEEAGAAGRVAVEQGLAELVHVVAGHVEHRAAHVVEAEVAGRVEQAELEDLLVGGEEVALDVIGDEGEGVGRRPLLLAGQALGDPVGQAVALGGVEFDGDAGLDEGGEPADLARRPVDLGQGDEGDDAVVEVAGVALQGFAAVAAGLAVGDAQVDQLAGAEQRQVAGGGLQFVQRKPWPATSTSRSA